MCAWTLLTPSLCTDSCTWQFSYYICSEHITFDTIRTICLWMNTCAETRQLHISIVAVPLPTKHKHMHRTNEKWLQLTYVYDILTVVLLKPRRVHSSGNTALVSGLIRSLCPSPTHTISIPFVRISVLYSVHCVVHFLVYFLCVIHSSYTQHRNRNQPKTFVTVSWLSTVAVPVRYSQRLNVCICFSIDNKVFSFVRKFIYEFYNTLLSNFVSFIINITSDNKKAKKNSIIKNRQI